MTTKFTFATDPRVVLLHLRLVLLLIGETLEGSIPLVLENVFERQQLDFSPFLFSSAIRCHLKKALAQGGYDPHDISEPVRLALNYLSNDGVDFNFDGLRIKALKGSVLPKPSSESRETFYAQKQDCFDFYQGDLEAQPLRNVITLWDYSPGIGMSSLLLLATKNAEGDLLWQLRVPSPAELVNPDIKLDSNDIDLDVDDESDEEQGDGKK